MRWLPPAKCADNPEDERAAVLVRAANLADARAEALTQAVTAKKGKVIRGARAEALRTATGWFVRTPARVFGGVDRAEAAF
jgi:acyl-CoA reductase-like NAD-dependent aldehyde dehydrogenase